MIKLAIVVEVRYGMHQKTKLQQKPCDPRQVTIQLQLSPQVTSTPPPPSNQYQLNLVEAEGSLTSQCLEPGRFGFLVVILQAMPDGSLIPCCHISTQT